MTNEVEAELRIALWNALREGGVGADLCYRVINKTVQAFVKFDTERTARIAELERERDEAVAAKDEALQFMVHDQQRALAAEQQLREAREVLEKISGGHIVGAADFAIAGNWHGLFDAAQALARAFLALEVPAGETLAEAERRGMLRAAEIAESVEQVGFAEVCVARRCATAIRTAAQIEDAKP